MANRKNLCDAVVMGIFALSLASASQLAVPSYAEAGLYEEYQAAQRAQSEAANQTANAETQQRLLEERKAARDASGSSTSRTDDNSRAREGTAEAFNNRIQAIIDSYSSRRRSGGSDSAASRVTALAQPAETFQPDDAAYDQAQDEAAYAEPVPVSVPLSEKKFDFKWVGTPLAQSLYALGSMSGYGIVINGELNGVVYMDLHHETCKTALDYLGRSFGFNWMFDGNNIIISDDKQMVQSEVFRVDYIDKDKVKEEFQTIGIDAEHIYANTETGTISVTGTPYQLQQARQRLNILDAPVSQCLLAAQLIEISHGKNNNLGFSYTLPSYSHSGIDGDTSDDKSLNGKWLPKFSFSASMQAARALNDGKVISRPIVLSRNGEKANISFGDRVPVLSETSTTASTNVTVTYEDVGTNLNITPVINERTGDVSLTIEAEVSNISNYVSQGTTKAPQISTRKVTTSTHVKSGQSFIIGGLMSSTELDNLSGIPGLMNLPILGELFKFHSTSKTYAEVYIMITPYIVTDDLDAGAIIRQIQE